jgi:hypothetical protein
MLLDAKLARAIEMTISWICNNDADIHFCIGLDERSYCFYTRDSIRESKCRLELFHRMYVFQGSWRDVGLRQSAIPSRAHPKATSPLTSHQPTTTCSYFLP